MGSHNNNKKKGEELEEDWRMYLFPLLRAKAGFHLTMRNETMSSYLAGAVFSPYFNASFFSLIFVNVLASWLSASVGGSLKTNAGIIEQVIQAVHSSCLSLSLSISVSPMLYSLS